MLKEKLEGYLNRKELSKKAIGEIIAILVQENYDSKEKTDELAEVLFALKADVIYGFAGYLDKMSAEWLPLFTESCIKAINPVKLTHAFVLAAAMNVKGYNGEYNKIIALVVQKYVLEDNVSKQVFISFERALRYGGAECLFGKFTLGDERTRNGYRKLLMEFLKYKPELKYAESVRSWFNANEIKISESEQAVIRDAARQTNGASEKKEEGGAAVQESKPKAADYEQVSLAQLSEAVLKNAAALFERAERAEKENGELKAEVKALNDKVREGELALRKANFEADSLKGKIDKQEGVISNLKSELHTAGGTIGDLKKRLEEITGKLTNVESAYGYAGQHEIEQLTGRIKKRLSLGYEKYNEIKEKEKDLAYYDILLELLDEIYSVLGKNGIKFD